MKNNSRAIAERFAIYSKLSWLDQRKLRRCLRWVSSDAVSLELLLDFEKKLEERSLFSWQILPIMLDALSWYNREDHDDRIQDRLQSDRLPEMLQIILVFLAKSQKLHYKYRSLILNIIHCGDNVGGSNPKINSIVTAERFRLEATELISNLNDGWGGWNGWHPDLENSANLALRYLVNIASKVSDLQLFTQFRLEAAKVFSHYRLSREKIGCLERIADKVNDLQSFSEVFNDVMPVIGLETTSSLMAISKDFQEFEVYYHRIIAQVERWGSLYISVFLKTKNASELDRLLVFLETLPSNVRMTRYILYTQTHRSGTLLTYISGGLQAQKSGVFQACWKHDWTGEPDVGRFMESQIDEFEQDIVHTYLGTIWRSTIESHKIRWEFDKFTDHIPYKMRAWDWTKDDEKTRPYWNSREAEGLEYKRYIDTLEPRLLSIFRKMDFSEIEALFDLLPNYLDIQGFTKMVKVPVEWEKDVIVQEGYQLHVGWYEEKVEVARPKNFIEHTFTFQRPYLQEAIDLLA